MSFRLKSLLFVWCFFFACSASQTFAVDYPGDCGVVIGDYASEGSFYSVKVLWTKSPLAKSLEKILDSKSLNQALLNLQKVCCENHKAFSSERKTVCEQDRPYFYEGNVPQSYYLFDHVRDVLIRRLEGNKKNRYLTDSLDPKGEAWYTQISSTMKQIHADENTTPKLIYETYKEYRSMKQENLLQGMMEDFPNALPEVIEEMMTWTNKEILERYEERTLAERYRNSCNIAGFIYALLADKQNLKPIRRTREQLIEKEGNKCYRYLGEKLNAMAAYTSYVSIAKSNMMLTDSISEYAQYLDKRLQNLQEKIGNSKVRLLRVVKAVPKLVHIVE